MDISSRFSLADFLAYLFPGILGTTGIYLLLILTPLGTPLINFSVDITAGIFFLVMSYIVGVVLSGFAEVIIRPFRFKQGGYIPLSKFEQEIKKAFRDVLGTKELNEWTRADFYLCRSIVSEYMPNAFQRIQRESGLRQLRMNMLPSIVIWLCAGIGWGWRIVNDGMQQWGITLIIVSVAFFILVFIVTLNRMQSNDERETRETLSAFLAGYKTGLFRKQNLSSQKRLT